MKRVIIFGNDHTNSVGLVQALGKFGYRSVALLYGKKTGLVKSSRFTDFVISGKDPQDCIDKLQVVIVVLCFWRRIKINCKNILFLSIQLKNSV